MTTKRTFVGVAAALAALLSAGAAFATSMVPANLAQMVEWTERAFVGNVVSFKVVQIEQGWAEEVTFRVTQPVLGDVSEGQTVTWHQFRFGPDVRVPGMPQYTVGAEHLVFLAGRAPGSSYQAPIALGQGSFRVHRDSETGAVYVRNEFMNKHLFDELDTVAIAEEVVDRDPALRSLAAAEKAQMVFKTEASLVYRRAGASHLGAVVSAAQTLKATPNAGERFKLALNSPNAKKSLKSMTILHDSGATE